MEMKMIRDILEKGPIAIAHRGDPLAKPQNTRSAFVSAMQYDIGMIETDVNMTKDGRLVVIHDQKVDNTSNGTGKVFDHTLSELEEFDFGSWMGEAFGGERILTLDEFIELTREKVPSLNIEIKNGPIHYPDIEEKTISIVKKYDMVDRVIISSFDHFALRKIKEIEPKVLTAILYHGGLIDEITPAINANADAIHPEYTLVTKETIKAAKDAGLFVNVWTVDDEADMKDMIDIGVNGIITNFPEKAARIIKGK
jgi:glycerophosphoryl diester phosphodiesterase